MSMFNDQSKLGGGGTGEVVSITGGGVVGDVMTATLASGWAATGYQWTRDGVDISGQTNSTYTTLSGDVGKLISCRVTGLTNSATGKTIAAASGGGIPVQRKLYDAITMHLDGTRSRPPIILGVGDSNFAGTGAGTGEAGRTGAFANSLMQALAGKLANLRGCTVRTGAFFGEGNTGIGSVTVSEYDPRLTLSGWVRATTPQTLGGRLFQTGTAGSVMTFNAGYPCDTAEVYLNVSGGNGVTEILASDDTVLATVTQNSAGSSDRKVVVTSSKLSTGIIKFKAGVGTDGGNPTYVAGAICYNSAEKSIIVCQGAWSAGRALNYASMSTPWRGAGFAKTIAPDLGIVALTINEIVNNGDPAAYKTSMNTVLNQFTPSADVIVATGFRCGGANFADASPIWKNIETATKEVADANPTRLIFKNMHEAFPSFSASQAAGYIYDDLHMTALGYSKQADEYATVVTSLAG